MKMKLDSDGYPTQSDLDCIAKWPSDKPHELMEFFKNAWEERGAWAYWGPGGTGTKLFSEYRISTGGWPGNKAIIAAMQRNAKLWSLYWESSHRTDLHIFRVEKK